MFAIVGTVVGGLVFPAAAESLLKAFVDSTTVELPGPAPNVNREPAGGKRVTQLRPRTSREHPFSHKWVLVVTIVVRNQPRPHNSGRAKHPLKG